MILTLRELADHLKVAERTILRMLKTGQIQGAKIGGQWRFNSSQIDALFFPAPGAAPEAHALPSLSLTHLAIPVSRMMAAERMPMNLQAADSEGVIGELTHPAVVNTLVLDVQGSRRKVLDREHLLSTGVGNGVAIPHPRDPVPTLCRPAIIVFGRSPGGVEFGAVDGAPVHLFFLLCCQTIELHLHLMGRLAHLLRQTSLVDACRSAETAEAIVTLALDHERAQFLQGD